MKRLPLFLIATLLGTFLVLGILVRYSVLQAFDKHASIEVQESSGAIMDKTMLAVSFIGSPVFVCTATVFLSFLFLLRHRRRVAFFLILTIVSLPLDLGLKEIWARARPDEKLIHVTGARFGYSFPSGHALMGTAFYGALAVLSWIHIRDTARRRIATGLLAFLPVAIGVSRVYLGAHWVSDVIGGYVGGLILLFVLTAFYVVGVHPAREGS